MTHHAGFTTYENPPKDGDTLGVNNVLYNVVGVDPSECDGCDFMKAACAGIACCQNVIFQIERDEDKTILFRLRGLLPRNEKVGGPLSSSQT